CLPAATSTSSSLARCFDVEGLADLGVLADQLAQPPRDLLLRRLDRLPELDRAEALGRLVRDPGPEAKAGNLLRGAVEVVPELVERRLGVREAPEDEPDDHSVAAG